ncbi:MAG: hypothetical protein JRD89_13315 [Deltaproteobacteria bacterium]|nr:hypothetical protein [Deltaproteobacteria bacterium]
MLKRSLPITITVLLSLTVFPVRAYEAHVEEIINVPTVICKKAFSIDATLEIWNRTLDNPCLMGQLWEIYEFKPSYNVTRTDTGIHISDSLGLTGDIRQIGQSDYVRTLYAAGSFDHWAVPFLFTASGVVIFEYTNRDERSGEVTIFIRGDNGISRFVMRLFSGILTRRINNRVESQLENMHKIIHDIVNDPHKIRDALTGQVLVDFDRVFPAAKAGTENQEVLFDLQRRMCR